jgi:very-short-patch-repair endonuclease
MKYRVINKLDSKLLYKKYIEEKKIAKQVALEMGVSYPTILRALKYYKIPIRYNPKPISKSILVHKYIKENKPMKVIAEELNRSIQSIHKYLHKYNIPVKEAQPYIHWTQRPENKQKVLKRNKKVKQSWQNIKKDPEKMKKVRKYCQKGANSTWKSICKTLKTGMNKKEKELNRLLQNIFPKEYKFVGNGKIFLDAFNPDFINCNGQKKIIELYGDYWHNLPDARIRNKMRLKVYRKYGYNTLVIWESELKNKRELKRKVKYFHNS